MKTLYSIILFCSIFIYPQSAFSQILITKNDTIQLLQDSAILTVNDYRGQIQWQQSADSVSWQDILNAQQENLLLTGIDSSGYYRAKITEGTCNPAYSDVLRIVFGETPKVATMFVLNITSSSAICEGEIVDSGSQLVTEKGVVWGTDPNPTIKQNKIIADNTELEFQVILEELESYKTYYIRTFATNLSGTSYGEEKIFTTYNTNQGWDDDSDCCRLKYAHLAIESVDYTNDKYRLLHDFLFELDRKYAYHVFTRNPGDFLMWCEMVEPENITSRHALIGATHETNHMINSDLRRCSPYLNQKYLSFDNIYETELSVGKTANYSIVEETISEILKNHSRYTTYIEGAKNSNGNDFRALMDELNSYIGSAWLDLKFFKSGLLPEIQGYTINDGGLGGMVNFMVYLECYLMSARLNYLETYQKIIEQEVMLKLIQDLWSKAEEILELSYPHTTISGTNASYRMDIDLDYFKAVFSNELLNELDQIGILHKPSSYWSDTYMK